MSERIFIGVAWPYANSPLHIGQIAGAYLPPDIFARYHRIKGNEVLMVSGSDQHGTPITIRAEQEGKTPAEIANKYHRAGKKVLLVAADTFRAAAVEQLKKVAADHGRSLTQFALAWVLNNRAITATICGASSLAQLEHNMKAAELKLTEEEFIACDDVWQQLRLPRFFYGR